MYSYCAMYVIRVLNNYVCQWNICEGINFKILDGSHSIHVTIAIYVGCTMDPDTFTLCGFDPELC